MTTLAHELDAKGAMPLRLAVPEPGERHLARSDYFGHLTDRALFPVDLYESDEGFMLVASLPGLNMEALRINIEGDQLAISARPDAGPAHAHCACLREERYKGPLLRTIALPAPIRADAVFVEYERGVLTLRLANASLGAKGLAAVAPPSI